MENLAKFHEAILADQRQTIYDVCEEVGLSYSTVQFTVAVNLKMKHSSERFVQKQLSDDQKAHRVAVCSELKQQARDDSNIISNIITGDDTWIYDYEPGSKRQSLQFISPNSPRLKKARQVRSIVIYMLIVFLKTQGIVHKEFLQTCQTVSGKFYCEVLKKLREGIRCKPPDKWKNNKRVLHHDEDPAHTSLVFRQFLTSKNITVIPNTSIRLILATCEFLIPKSKLRLKGSRFNTTEGIHAKSQEVIDKLTFENFQGCMKSWETHSDPCIHAQGNYFEGEVGN